MNVKPSKVVMQAAIQGAKLKETPFGAALAMGDQVFATATHQTRHRRDSAAHAEIKVIRKLIEETRKSDLAGFTLYSTCEPCEICRSEIIDRGIETVVYGCGNSVVKKYINEIQTKDKITTLESRSGIDFIGNFLKEECEVLLQKFSKR